MCIPLLTVPSVHFPFFGSMAKSIRPEQAIFLIDEQGINVNATDSVRGRSRYHLITSTISFYENRGMYCWQQAPVSRDVNTVSSRSHTRVCMERREIKRHNFVYLYSSQKKENTMIIKGLLSDGGGIRVHLEARQIYKCPTSYRRSS